MELQKEDLRNGSVSGVSARGGFAIKTLATWFAIPLARIPERPLTRGTHDRIVLVTEDEMREGKP